MLVANLWVSAKLYNGTVCQLESVVYASAEDKARGIIAYAVMSSPEYIGPVFDADIPNSFRVPTLMRPSTSRPGIWRTQLPLLAAAGITVHKSQGMTLPEFFGLFGDREIALGSTYVMLSRAVTLSGMVFRDQVTLKRLVGLSRSDRADQRRAFELDLDARAIQTLTAWSLRADLPLGRQAAIITALTEAQAAHVEATLKAEQRKLDRAAAAKAEAIVQIEKRKADKAAVAAGQAPKAPKRSRIVPAPANYNV